MISILYGFGDWTASDKTLSNKVFNITNNTKCYGYQRGLFSLVYKSFDKKSPGGVVKIEIIQKRQLAKELHKSIIRKLKNQKYNHHLLTIFGVLIWPMWP